MIGVTQQEAEKKAYAPPRLTVHGAVQNLTRDEDDGFDSSVPP